VPVSIRPLGKKHDRAAFSCGVEALDKYLRVQAGQDQRKGLARVFVAEAQERGTVAGFYTLSTISVDVGALPAELSERIPYSDVPAALIGRLAVDRRYQGQRLGEHLLIDALKRIVDISQTMAILAVVVDAKEGAVSFYRKYGFIPFPNRPDRLFLPVATARKLF